MTTLINRSEDYRIACLKGRGDVHGLYQILNRNEVTAFVICRACSHLLVLSQPRTCCLAHLFQKLTSLADRSHLRGRRAPLRTFREPWLHIPLSAFAISCSPLSALLILYILAAVTSSRQPQRPARGSLRELRRRPRHFASLTCSSPLCLFNTAVPFP